MTVNWGKRFEEDIQKSCEEQGIFYYRIKDVSPTMLKPKANVSKNDYDSFVYKKPNLFPIEFKSTKGKSISFDNAIIKHHQIKALENAVKYDGLIAGFIFNFREPNNFAYFVHINDFLKYKHVAENGVTDHTYKSKVNGASIPLNICREIGIEVKNSKKRTRYRYQMKSLLQELIERYEQTDFKA